MATDYAHVVRRLVQSSAPRLLMVNTSFGRAGVRRDAAYVWAGKTAGKRVVVFFRGWDPSYEPDFNRPPDSVLRSIFFRADRILVLASEFAEKLRRWGYPGEVTIETTVVDDRLIDGFGERDVRERTMRSALTLTFLSRIERSKGIYEALDAFRTLSVDLPSLRMTVAGDGSELNRAIRAAGEAGMDRVSFLGHVDGEQKARVLREADIFVFPTSHGEGLPNAVVEAMAFGLPIVARRVGGIPDIVSPGLGGLLYEGPVAELVAHLRALIDSPHRRIRMGLRNLRLARRRFLASLVAERLERTWREVANGGTG